MTKKPKVKKHKSSYKNQSAIKEKELNAQALSEIENQEINVIAETDSSDSNSAEPALKNKDKTKKKDKNKTEKQEAVKNASFSGFLKKHDVFAKAFSLFAAIVLWFYVVGVETDTSEKTFSGIKIDIADISATSGYSVISGYDNTVSVTVSGKRSEINRLRASDIEAYVSLAGIKEPGEHSLKVNTKYIPTGSVVQIEPGSVYVYIDKTISKSVPVKTEYTGGTTDTALVIDDIITTHKTVTVTGPAEIVESVFCAKMNLDLGLISSSVEVREKIVLCDEEGNQINNPYLTTNVSEMKATVPVYKYATVPVILQFNGVIDGDDIDYTVSPAEVTIKGTPDALEGITSLLTDPIDESKIDGKTTYNVKLIVPPNVKLDRDSDTVAASIELINNASKTITLTSDKFEPLGTSSKARITVKTSSIDVVLRGPRKDLANYNADSVYAQFDLTNVSDTGLVKVPLIIRGINSTSIYPSGDYFIEVEIDRK